MITEMQKIRAKHKAERKSARACDELRALLPFPGARLYQHKDHAAATYSKERFPNRYTLVEAGEIVKAYAPNIVPAVHALNGCLSCKPEAINEYLHTGNATREGSHAVELVLNAGKGYESHALKFWALLGARWVEVQIEIHPRASWLPVCDFKYDSDGYCSKSSVSPMGIGEHTRRGWWNPPGGYRLSYYWQTVPTFETWAAGQAGGAI